MDVEAAVRISVSPLYFPIQHQLVDFDQLLFRMEAQFELTMEAKAGAASKRGEPAGERGKWT